MLKIVPKSSKTIKSLIGLLLTIMESRLLLLRDNQRFLKYSFLSGSKLKGYDYIQLEAQIIKTQHSIEKGLALKNTRLGFGLKHIELLEQLLLEYISRGNPKDSEVVDISLDTMSEYINFHRKNDYELNISPALLNLISSRSSTEKNGGYNDILRSNVALFLNEKFDLFVRSRKSIRDFSDEDVEIETIYESIEIALNTPSVCNRQSWNVRIVSGSYIDFINANQNGNSGFGDKINKYLIVTSDLRAFSKPRERNQAYIDGGLFAMNLLLSLHHKGLATIPMSASLSNKQESNIRSKFELNDSEVLIIFIAVGHYPEEFKVAFSKRKKLSPKIFSD